MSSEDIFMLEDTLQICEKGAYSIDGQTIPLRLSRQQMTSSLVFLPEDVKKIMQEGAFWTGVGSSSRCDITCENRDSFSLARERCRKEGYVYGEGGQKKGDVCGEGSQKEVLVLNMANPVNPGGGVRRGARAQEEDLCRKSSLLLALEDMKARPYYHYNRSKNTYMGSDAIVITPKVEIIKDEYGQLLPESVVTAVLTCAAPCLSFGREGLSQKEYEDMVYNRIRGMLGVSASLGYTRLVLGAWGCGAFRNDARVVAQLFFRALSDKDSAGRQLYTLFDSIDFAVLARGREQYNLQEFSRFFTNEHFYAACGQSAPNGAEPRDNYRDKIRGSLFGGAVGDALGYAIEFMQEKAIFQKYGEGGIREYELSLSGNTSWSQMFSSPGTEGEAPFPDLKAVFSDDTQMTLFTANGLLYGDTCRRMEGNTQPPAFFIAQAYQDWLRTQKEDFETARQKNVPHVSWLFDVPELFHRRAPGNTCMSALLSQEKTGIVQGSFVENPRNNSKGCGGVMRVAPVGLFRPEGASPSLEDVQKLGAEAAAITHGSPLGYLPAAILAHIVYQLVYGEKGLSLKEIVLEARRTMESVFEGTPSLDSLSELIDIAVELSENAMSDLDNIHRIGEGWTGEEALSIAIYCALRHTGDFSSGVIAAVNHRGDSDSTGAITGNILGAMTGYEAIEDKWKEKLEMKDVLLEMADDLCQGCRIGKESKDMDEAWTRKYIRHRWKEDPED